MDRWRPGDWWAVCAICGNRYYASELVRHWHGNYWCRRCWEPRHPQDFVRGIPDRPGVPWTQPRTGLPPSTTLDIIWGYIDSNSRINDYLINQYLINSANPKSYTSETFIFSDTISPILVGSFKNLFGTVINGAVINVTYLG